MAYFLNTEAMRVIERNERGTVVYRKRYRKGDEVDTSHMDDARVEYLVSQGTLVQSEDDLDEQESATGTSPVSPPFGASTEGQGDDADSATTPGEDEAEAVDEYSDMDYASLQKEAKSRDLSGAGSAEDLRARLRADDADES